MSLIDQLARIDRELLRKRPKLHATLLPGVGARALARLGRQACEGALPPDIATWFAWHDGQRSRDGIDGAFFLCSLDAAIAIHPTLARPRWLPLLANEAGDHIVYDRPSGAVLQLQRANNQQLRRATTLAHYARALADALAEEAAVAELAIELGRRRRWAPIDKLPTERELASAPIGAAYHYDVPRGRRVVVKTAPSRWLPATAPTIEAAIARWQDLIAGSPPRHAWRSARDVRSELADHAEGAQQSVP